MATAQAKKTYPLMSRGDIEALIAGGRKVFIVEQHVLRADAWLSYHPGGDKAILHMVGKDATDEVTAYVSTPSPGLHFSIPWASQLTSLAVYIQVGRSIG